MKRAILLFAFAASCLLLPTHAHAACTGSPNCTVKAGGGGGYTTIQACATAMANGDTCTVFAGTYAEHVTVSAGGVASYKTLTVNPGDTVNVLDFTLGSHDKINGFHITNPSSPNSSDCVTMASNATDFFITNNTITACGSHAMIFEPQTGSNVNHGFITGNTMSYSCSTSGAPNVCGTMQINGDYHLIESNDISHVSDGPYLYGSHNILRNNTFHNTIDSDCGSNSGNCHVDFFQVDANVVGGSPVTGFLLVEGNTVNSMQNTNGHASGLFQGQVCNGQCGHAVVRFNVSSHYGSGALSNDNSSTAPSAPNSPPWIYVKAYNNTWVDGSNDGNLVGGINSNFSHGSYGGSSINELYYYPETVTDFNPYACVDSSAGTSLGSCTGPPVFAYGHSLAWCTGSPCTFHSHVYGSGSFTSDTGNQVADPLFVSYAGNNFHLQAGSPAIGTGTSLTTAVGLGSSSTALTVADAAYFQDNPGSIAGVSADWIRIGASTTVQISSINYSTNVITLANAVSWSDGDGVYLYKNSSGTVVLNAASPDIGAFQSSGLSFSPTSADFGPQHINTTSSGIAITITNNSTGTVTLTSELLQTGTQFAISANTCGGSLGSAATCVVTLTFTPTSAAAQSDNLVVTSSGVGSPQSIPLTGTGFATASVFTGTSVFKGTSVIH